jgi:hypothetical protein
MCNPGRQLEYGGVYSQISTDNLTDIIARLEMAEQEALKPHATDSVKDRV